MKVQGLFLIILTFFSTTLIAGGPDKIFKNDKEKVIVALIDVDNVANIENCYLKKYEKKRMTIHLDENEVLSNLLDYTETEDVLSDANCFIPNIKLIYKDYTYVMSTFCTAVVKFRNEAPYKTSSDRLVNDFVFTESTLEYLEKLVKDFKGPIMYDSTTVEQYSNLNFTDAQQNKDEDSFGFDSDDDLDNDIVSENIDLDSNYNQALIEAEEIDIFEADLDIDMDLDDFNLDESWEDDDLLNDDFDDEFMDDLLDDDF